MRISKLNFYFQCVLVCAWFFPVITLANSTMTSEAACPPAWEAKVYSEPNTRVTRKGQIYSNGWYAEAYEEPGDPLYTNGNGHVWQKKGTCKNENHVGRDIEDTDAYLADEEGLARAARSVLPWAHKTLSLTTVYRHWNDRYIPWVDDVTNTQFLRSIPWEYTDDGCFARATALNYRMTDLYSDVPKLQRIFLFGKLSGWLYHVALVSAVEGQVVVLDPTFGDKTAPMPLAAWLQVFADNEEDPIGEREKYKIAICDANASTTNSPCNGGKESARYGNTLELLEMMGGPAGRVSNVYGKGEWGVVTARGDDPVKLLLGGETMQPISMLTWGNDNSHQLTPPAELANDAYIRSIAMGNACAAGVTSRGKVIVWGKGQFTACNITSAPLTDVRSVAMGGSHMLALQTNGKVAAWELNEGKPIAVPSTLSIVSIAAQGNTNIALNDLGSVVIWGIDIDHAAFLRDNNLISAIAAGQNHALILREGSVIALGTDNTNGQLDVPDSAKDGQVKAIAAGYIFNLALKNDGTIVGWGGKTQFTDGIHIPAGLNSVRRIFANSAFAFAEKADGEIIAWGLGTSAFQLPATLANMQSLAVGKNAAAALIRR